MRIFANVVLGLISAILTALVVGVLVMFLWNACLVGTVAGIKIIGFWKAFGISLLCNLLFKNSLSVRASSKERHG